MPKLPWVIVGVRTNSAGTSVSEVWGPYDASNRREAQAVVDRLVAHEVEYTVIELEPAVRLGDMH